MKIVKIFLASSIEDLKDDRLEIGSFVNQLNNIYVKSGVFFSLVMCEEYDNSITVNGKQAQFDEEIRESELVFFLFFRKVGEYTKHEFEVALEAFRKNGKPKVITYFKYEYDTDEATEDIKEFRRVLDEEVKINYAYYQGIDSLKLGIIMQIKLMCLDSSEIKLEDGEVCINGKGILDIKNVPIIHGNNALWELTQEKKKLKEKLQQCLKECIANPYPENDDERFDVSVEYNKVSRKLREREDVMMDFLSTWTEMIGNSKIPTYELNEGLRFFNIGENYVAALLLFNPDKNEVLTLEENRAKLTEEEIRSYVDETLLDVKSEIAQEDRFKIEKIKQRFENMVAIGESYKPSILYDYARFLYKQKDFGRALEMAEKLKQHYNNPGTHPKDTDVATLSILLGRLYHKNKKPVEAEKAYKATIEIYTRLSELNPDAYLPALADAYFNLGEFYDDIRDADDTKNAKDAYVKGLEIVTELHTKHPELYEARLAQAYLKLGTFYRNTMICDETEASERAYRNAIELYTKLCAQNPETYEPKLAESYKLFAILYTDVLRCDDTEDLYMKALDIYINLSSLNPDAYFPEFADTCGHLAYWYDRCAREEDAKEAYLLVIDIYTKLISIYPDTYGPKLADTYSQLNILYLDAKSYREAERIYLKLLLLYTRLSNHNPEYEEKLAEAYLDFGNFCRDKNFENAESALNSALDIYKELCAQNPEKYEPKVAGCYDCLGFLYKTNKRYIQAEEAYLKSLEIKKKLSKTNPSVYDRLCDEEYLRLALLYHGLANDFYRAKDYEKAKPLYIKALENYKLLEKRNPGEYQGSIDEIEAMLKKMEE